MVWGSMKQPQIDKATERKVISIYFVSYTKTSPQDKFTTAGL